MVTVLDCLTRDLGRHSACLHPRARVQIPPLPLVNIVEEVGAELRSRGYQRIALLSLADFQRCQHTDFAHIDCAKIHIQAILRNLAN